MKNTTNVFLKGMTSDMHPLTTSQLEYTDALNATLITFNGNEQMMQNDMGNTLIQDSKTGNIMGLREGFIPVGMKEHGGIMYIASVNKDGVGEIGTIPSPIIRYNNPETTINPEKDISAFPSNPSELIKLTNNKVYPGERFAVAIKSEKADDIHISVESEEDLVYPFYSTINKKGLYKIKLYSQTDDLVFDLEDITVPKDVSRDYSYKYKLIDQEQLKGYSTWFADVDGNNVEFDIDSMNILESSGGGISFLHYPNIPSGYPSIRIEAETLNKFYLMPHSDSNVSYPLTFFHYGETPDLSEYIIAIPGFIYETESAVHVDKIEYSIIKNSTREKVLLTIPIPGSSEKVKVYQHVVSLKNKNENEDENEYKRFKLSDTKFQISKSDATTESDVENDFDEDSVNILSYFSIPRDELDTWFTLEVTYYNDDKWPDYPLGRYSLQFNQFVMDLGKKLFNFIVEPEDLTHKVGNTDHSDKYIRQAYELYPPTLVTDLIIDSGNYLSEEKSFLEYFDSGNSGAPNGLDDHYNPSETVFFKSIKDLNRIDEDKKIVRTNETLFVNLNISYLYNSKFYNPGRIYLAHGGSMLTLRFWFDLSDSSVGHDVNILLSECFNGAQTSESNFQGKLKIGDNIIDLQMGQRLTTTLSESVREVLFGTEAHCILSESDTISFEVTPESEFEISCIASADFQAGNFSANIPLKLVYITLSNLNQPWKLRNDSMILLNVPNLSNYYAIPQYNLLGKNEFSDTDYIRYGYSPEYESFEPVNLQLQWDGNKYKDGGVYGVLCVDDSHTNQLDNSFRNAIPLYKTQSRIITNIESGTYFLNFKLRNSSDINTLRFKIYQGTDENSGIEFYLDKDGGIINSTSLFSIELETSGKQLYNAGLYKIDKTIKCDLNEALFDHLGNAALTYLPNTNYKYVVPQLCWGYDESGIECGKKTYQLQNYGIYGFLTTDINDSEIEFTLRPVPLTLNDGEVETVDIEMPDDHYNINSVPIRKYLTTNEN